MWELEKFKKMANTETAVTPSYGGFRSSDLDTVAISDMRIFLRRAIVQGRSKTRISTHVKSKKKAKFLYSPRSFCVSESFFVSLPTFFICCAILWVRAVTRLSMSKFSCSLFCRRSFICWAYWVMFCSCCWFVCCGCGFAWLKTGMPENVMLWSFCFVKISSHNFSNKILNF